MKKRALMFAQANPVHDGHIVLLKAALEDAEHVDVYVPNAQRKKHKPSDLPYEIKLAALQAAIEAHGLQEKVTILGIREEVRGNLVSISPDLYEAIVMGSDVANLLDPELKILRPQEREYFLSFTSMVILQRRGHELTQAAEAEIRRYVQELLIHTGKIDLGARDIRRKYREGEDIRPYLPDGVWEIIQDHVDVFHKEEKK